MDQDLRQQFLETLDSAQRENEVTLTPHAIVLLTMVIEAIADGTNDHKLAADVVRNAQLKAIGTIPEALRTARRAYKTQRIDGMMLLTLMPRFMSAFCPPFENPPPY